MEEQDQRDEHGDDDGATNPFANPFAGIHLVGGLRGLNLVAGDVVGYAVF
jgi:hypothetical protein